MNKGTLSESVSKRAASSQALDGDADSTQTGPESFIVIVALPSPRWSRTGQL